MEDDNTKEDNQPSKKDSQRMTSEQDLYTERRKYEERREEHASNSGSSTSASYSAGSRIDVAGVRPEIPKPPVVKRETKPPEKKRRGRRPGRVEKRKRSPARRAPTRRAPKRKPRKERDLSVSTIFTRLSSESGGRTPGCKFCGHRCCRRRFEYERRNNRRRYRKCRRVQRRKTRLNPRLKSLYSKTKGSKHIQVGSRSMMLSPLFVNTNAAAPEELVDEKIKHCEVTPEMIYETLKRLTMWRQFVRTAAILDHLKRNYPVNYEDTLLLLELTNKLNVAAVVGILTKVAEDYWCLNSALHQRALTESHVTKFWQVYADTMRPVKKKPDANRSQTTEEE